MSLLRSVSRKLLPRRTRRWLYELAYFRSESAGLTRLAPRGAARLWMGTVRLLLPLKAAAPVAALRRTPLTVTSEAAGRVHVAHWCDLLVLGEIYAEPREYDFAELPPQASTIVDVGANVGFAARYFSERYPQASIVAYEPDPEAVSLARRNLAGRPQVTLRTAAVAAAPGSLTLHRFPGGSWGTSSFVTFQEVAETFTAEAVTLDSIVEELGRVDILKIDIEGGEYEVLRGCRSLDRVGCIVGEVHAIPGETSERLFAELEGFEVVAATVEDGQGPFLAVRRQRA
jgi:FkbM family methyltransferase